MADAASNQFNVPMDKICTYSRVQGDFQRRGNQESSSFKSF